MERLTVETEPSPEGLWLERLTPEKVGLAKELCDHYVGINLYSMEELAAIPRDPNHFFYFLNDAQGSVMGYFYFLMSDLAESARRANLPLELMQSITPKPDPVVGIMQSIGISGKLRKMGLSDWFIDFGLKNVEKLGADVAVGVAWKPGGKVPMKHALENLGFRFLADSHRVWYNIPELYCPVCKGRCVCDGAVYYKVFARK